MKSRSKASSAAAPAPAARSRSLATRSERRTLGERGVRQDAGLVFGQRLATTLTRDIGTVDEHRVDARPGRVGRGLVADGEREASTMRAGRRGRRRRGRARAVAGRRRIIRRRRIGGSLLRGAAGGMRGRCVVDPMNRRRGRRIRTLRRGGGRSVGAAHSRSERQTEAKTSAVTMRSPRLSSAVAGAERRPSTFCRPPKIEFSWRPR